MTDNPLLLEYRQLSDFGDDALYRGLEKIWENRHSILIHILRILKNQLGV
ncbi:MAG: hypothetical protein NT038_02365 [Euryarchaeota archaeon]|nr:hypothetical protein [Euryarchaeota archaeon]